MGAVCFPGCSGFKSPLPRLFLTLRARLPLPSAAKREKKERREEKGNLEDYLALLLLVVSSRDRHLAASSLLYHCSLPASTATVLPPQTYKMGSWVLSVVTEGKLLEFVEKGLLLPKEVARWRATAGERFSWPRAGEAVSFLDYHKHGYGLPAFDFIHGFLHELQHLSPNVLL